MPSIGDRFNAAYKAFFNPSQPPAEDARNARYNALYAFWAGDWQKSNLFYDQRINDKQVYKNTRQLWRNAGAIVNLYNQFVYAGNSLSSGVEPLSDGTRGAIPIDVPQSNPSGDALRKVISEWWDMTNYRTFMSQRPKYCAILGDCLTEIIDDRDHGVAYPQIVWPGHVKYLELDSRDNVKAYILEYGVDIPEMTAFGITIPGQNYTYRKEVSGDGFWVYHDDRLMSADPNPYTFCPAVWDRHEKIFGQRGIGAIDKIYQQAVEANSMLSGAMDYQQKQYGAPIGVKGATLNVRQKILEMAAKRGASSGDPMADAAQIAETLGLLPMTDNGDFVTLNFDIGKTVQLLQVVLDSMQSEAPESQYSQQILEMTQVTAPGVERAMGPIIGMVQDVRKGSDTQTVKIKQMCIAIMGWRVQGNGYPTALVRARQERYQAFAPFNLESFGHGLLEFQIPDRPVIPDTIDERIARQLQIEQLQWEYSLQVAGLPPDVVAQVTSDRKAEADRQAKLDEIVAVGPPADNAPGSTNDNQAAA